MDLSPAQKARRVGLVMLAGIFLVLAVFLLVTWLAGDPTNHRKEQQPSPSPSAAGQRPRSGVDPPPAPDASAQSRYEGYSASGPLTS